MSISSARKTARGRRTEIHVTQEREETALMCVEQRRVGMRLFPSLLRADIDISCWLRTLFARKQGGYRVTSSPTLHFYACGTQRLALAFSFFFSLFLVLSSSQVTNKMV